RGDGGPAAVEDGGGGQLACGDGQVDLVDALFVGDGGADGVVGEQCHRVAGVGAGVQFRGLDLGAEDRGHRRGDHDGHGELVAQAAGEVDAVPAEVGGVDDAVVGDAAGGGHADGGEGAVEASGEAVE